MTEMVEFAQQNPWTAGLIIALVTGGLSLLQRAIEPPPPKDYDW